MFTEKYRESIRDKIIQKSRDDKQILSAAVIGSYARNEVDKYSDIDLTFGINHDHTVDQVSAVYKEYIDQEFTGAFLFTLEQDFTKYGVFLLPGCLQVDLSFTPQSEFGPKAFPFKLIFGNHTGEKTKTPPKPIIEKFGLIAHHILRTKVCLERNQLVKANEWQNLAQNYILDINPAAKIVSPKNKEIINSKNKILQFLNLQLDCLSKIQHSDSSAQNRIISILDDLRN